MRKGMVHIYYGGGKGKTTAALGTILRALSYDMQIGLIKFFKTKNSSGEDRALKKFKNIKIICSRYPHPQFIKTDKKKKQEAIQHQSSLFDRAKMIVREDLDMVLLDEVLDLIKDGIITTKDMTGLIRSKNKNIELILTGHYINKDLKNEADLVTEMKKIKHYYDNNILARKGVEY